MFAVIDPLNDHLFDLNLEIGYLLGVVLYHFIVFRLLLVPLPDYLVVLLTGIKYLLAEHYKLCMNDLVKLSLADSVSGAVFVAVTVIAVTGVLHPRLTCDCPLLGDKVRSALGTFYHAAVSVDSVSELSTDAAPESALEKHLCLIECLAVDYRRHEVFVAVLFLGRNDVNSLVNF